MIKKFLLKFGMFAAQAALFGAWQYGGSEIAGRLLIFSSWSLASLFFAVSALLIAARLSSKKQVDPITKSSGSSVAISWIFLILVVGGFVAAEHEFLAASYLAASLLLMFVMSVGTASVKSGSQPSPEKGGV